MKTFVTKFARQVIACTLMVSVLMPHVANAQLAVTAPILEAQTITDYIGRMLKVVFRNVAVVGAVNVSQQIARDAAESLATWIVKGAPGQNPLAYMKSPGDYVKDHTQQALGGVLDQMSEDFANASLLCIANPAAPLGILAGLYGALNSAANTSPFNNKGQNISGLSTGTLGKCDVGSIAVSYKSLANELSSEQLLNRFNSALLGGGSEMTTIFESQLRALASLVREQKNAELERTATKTHTDLKSPIAGNVLQPSSVVTEDSKLNSVKFQMEQEAQMLGGVLASGAEAIPAIFATTLANSLSKKLIARLKQGKGTIPSPSEINLANIFGSGRASTSGGPTSIYTDVKTAVITESELDLLTTFAACPDKFAQPDNCVIDSKFESAIRAASAGKPLTVREAIDQGKLDANWELVPPSQTARNEDRLCFKSAYCHSNLMKLRKARIIPIGWEIAAATADGTGKVTLGQVVNGFNKCSYGPSGEAIRDKENPYCHLIDPNWVLKMPEQICRAKVYGALPENEYSANRQEICADQASCLEEDANGQCTGAYGYCLKERNTFRLSADSCPAAFAGCRTFNNAQFGQVSLIESTLNSDVCTDKNAGCLGYAVDYKLDGQFDTSQPKVYLNNKAVQCEAQYAGCSEVQNASTGQTQFVRIAPPSLGCKGLSTDPSACNQYAKACTADEVGCEVYQPVGSSDPQIPGVATFATRNANGQVVDGQWNDECSAECVGYASYYQAPTQTEPIPSAPVAFIPKTAQACSQDMVGCDAYTNIDAPTKGGGAVEYFSSLQKCTDPAVESNHAVFYSWEGSDQSGYQLRQHDLTIGGAGTAYAGKPVYDANSDELNTLLASCTADIYETRVLDDGKPNPAYNSDCRELFDQAGTAHYRLLSRTIVSSPSCTAFKKDDTNQANCVASRGTFDSASGACTYNVLPTGSTSCKAEFVGCRAYNGAAALSPKKILDDEFVTLTGWTGGELSNEGITVGDEVLRISGSSASHEISITQGKTYSITFWSKGVGGLNVKFVRSGGADSVTLNTAPLVVSTEWKQFQVSTAVAPWTDANANIVFEKTSGSGLLYIENLVVKEQADVQYVIKNSWETPLMCDPNPQDALPGPALNCQEYKPTSDTKKTNVYLTGFTGLCRPAVAGCQKFVNTYNTPEVTEREITAFGATAKRTVPADEFVYAVANTAAFCPADKKGCTAMGVPVNGGMETTYRINLPDQYETTACLQTEEWCQAFDVAGSTGQQRYFKFPDKSSRCEYSQGKEVNGVTYSGWFKEGTTESCYSGFVSGGNTYGIYKNQDAGYTGMVATCQPEFNQCTEFVDRADVSKEFPAGRPYFFMKNNRLDTQSCNGKVSLKEGCVAIDDTSDGNKTIATLATYCKSDGATDPNCAKILTSSGVSSGDQGKDGVLVAPVSGPQSLTPTEASGLNCAVARQNGLFVATDCEAQLSRLKQASSGITLTCANSKAVDDAVKAGKSICSKIADANTIVKVSRDRTCSEWLACKSSISVFDSNTQKYKEVCTDLGVCNKLSSDTGAVGRCANWITDAQISDEEELARALPLSTNRYVSRNVGWYGKEYSGYSLWNKFQPDRVGLFSKAGGTGAEQIMGVGFNSQSCLTSASTGATCTATIFTSNDAKAAIQKEFGPVNTSGTCYEQKCWYPLSGFNAGSALQDATYVSASCRGYAEADSPFPVSVISETNFFGLPLSKASGYGQVNVCDVNRDVKLSRSSDVWTSAADFALIRGGATVFTVPNSSCECSYKKVKYGQSDTRYFSTDVQRISTETFQVGSKVLIRPTDGSAFWVNAQITSKNPENTVFSVRSLATSGGYESNKTYTGLSLDQVAFFNGAISPVVGDLIVAAKSGSEYFSEVEVLKGFAANFPLLPSESEENKQTVSDLQSYLGLLNAAKTSFDTSMSGTELSTLVSGGFSNYCGQRVNVNYPNLGLKGKTYSVDCLGYQFSKFCKIVNTNAISKSVEVMDETCVTANDVLTKTKSLRDKIAETLVLLEGGQSRVNLYRTALKYLNETNFIKNETLSNTVLSQALDTGSTGYCKPYEVEGDYVYSKACIDWYYNRFCQLKGIPKSGTGASIENCQKAYDEFELHSTLRSWLLETIKSMGGGDGDGDAIGQYALVGTMLKKEDKIKSAGTVPDGICTGGWYVVGDKTVQKPTVHSKKGMACSADIDCIDERVMKLAKPIDGKETDSWQYSTEDGKCEYRTEETTVIGWKGFCLEEDFRTRLDNSSTKRACLTWLPIDAATTDLYNQFDDAAYKPDPDGTGKYYCTETKGFLPNNSSQYTGHSLGLIENSIKDVYENYWSVDITKLKDPGNTISNVSNNSVPTFRSDDIDFVELESADGNPLFPSNYKIRIVRDGRVRVYTPDAMKKFCEVKSQSGALNFLDPASAPNTTVKNHYANVLSILSQQVRCDQKNNSDIDCSAGPYLATASDIPKPTEDHFICLPGGETKMAIESDYNAGNAIAITGVAQAGLIQNMAVNQKDNRVPAITSSAYGEIWFLRADLMRVYSTYAGSAFLVDDIIRGTDGTVGLGSGVGSDISDCSSWADSGVTNELSGYTLRLKFKPDGSYAGTDAAACRSGKNWPQSFNWRLKIYFRDTCTEVAQVVNGVGENKAATQKLWEGYPKSSQFKKAVENGVNNEGSLVFTNGGVISPVARFGSMALNTEPDDRAIYAFIRITSRTGTNFTDVIGSQDTRSYSCEGSQSVCVFKTSSATAKADGRNALSQLFGKVYTSFVYNELGGSYVEVNKTDSAWDKSGEQSALARAPAIFAFDPTTCGGLRGATCRLTQKYGFTVNGEYEKNSVVFGRGSLTAMIQFYGYAHQDHMPLKRITLDWGDGTVRLQREGMYRNSKPVCSTSTKPASACKFGTTIDYNHTCAADNDCVDANGTVAGTCVSGNEDLRWSFGSWAGNGGSDIGACQEGFFQFSHAYSFSDDCGGTGAAQVATPENINTLGLEGRVGIGERFCVFKPRVQLMDNWDVCNGDGAPAGGLLSDGARSCDAKGIGSLYQGSIIVKE